jgi:membrane AbrB-like protein
LTNLRKTCFAALGGFSPRIFPYGRFAAALLLGSVGAWVFLRLNLPLPWMLGSMTICTIAALLRVPIASPGIVRPPMTTVIGVMLGAGFSPSILGQLSTWLPSVIGLVLCTAVCGLVCVAYFRRAAGFDGVTAYFCGMPGGLAEMIVMGEQKGGDERTIALIHSARILLIVFSIPFLVQAVGGFSLGARPQVGASVADMPLWHLVWLIVTAAAGAFLGRLLRLPAANLLGPMVVSATIHSLGLTDFVPAREIVNAAQLVFGTSIGCRFAGTPSKEVLRILVLSLGSTAILLAITSLFAVVVSRLSHLSVATLLLAYSPGGLAEMSVVALGLGIEVAFVAAHHILRVLLVVGGAGPGLALWKKWAGG